jgi:hypothetical protein
MRKLVRRKVGNSDRVEFVNEKYSTALSNPRPNRAQRRLLKKKRAAAQKADLLRLKTDFRPWCAAQSIPLKFTDEEVQTAYLWLESPADGYDDDSDDGLPDDLVANVGDFIMGR